MAAQRARAPGRQVASLPWGSGLSELADGLSQRPLLFLPLLLVIGALLWRRKYLYRAWARFTRTSATSSATASGTRPRRS
jgi:hypothetical protein